MNLVDLIIIVLLVMGALVGFKRGLIRQLLSLCGTIIAAVLAFLFKTPLAQLLCEYLPFFSFKGVLAGLSVLNLFVYEVIAFLIILAIFVGLLQVLIFLSNILEKIVSMTIIFALPSKLAGAVFGVLENYIVVFIILYIVSLPFFNIDIIRGSELRDPIVTKTPVLNKLAEKSVEVGTEIANLVDKYKIEEDKNQYNLDTLDVLLKYNITKVETVDRLVEKNKIQLVNIDLVLSKYRD
ncbi:MAG: CvpA family protein [Bacilli bacterium]|jgi:uncharacterized membrane protein required for colicin V production|nr:CvpA family protein [Bacilli bacterium]